MNQQNRPWKKISVASEKKRLEHWSCFCSQVQFSIWCCILKLTKGLNFERAQYCLISNASVFLENLCKPELLGGALFYGNSSKFLFSNPPGLALFHIACKKFSIWSKNLILGFHPEIFYQIKVVSRSARPRATQPGYWYFWFFFHFSTKKCPNMAQNTVFGPENNSCWSQNALKLKSILHPLVTYPRKEI